MKFFSLNRYASLVGALSAALWFFAAPTQAATPGAAEVKKVVGTANYTDATGGGPIKEGQILMAGATITTGAGSYVDLDLKVNGNALRVEADSTLAINKLEFTKAIDVVVNTEVQVTKGAVVANVINKLSKASKYEIKTPAGVAGIRGTALRASTIRITCLIGTISFVPTLGGGAAVVITGGNAFAPGTPAVVKAPAAETSGLAKAATQLTANAVTAQVTQVIQQFTAALAADAAVEAAKAGGNSAAAATAAANSAKAVVAELVQAVREVAAQAAPQVQVNIQLVVTTLTRNSESLTANAAAAGAGIGVKVVGGTDAQAQAASSSAATAVTSNQAVVNQAVNQAKPSITVAQPNQNPTVVVDNRPPPPAPAPAPGQGQGPGPAPAPGQGQGSGPAPAPGQGQGSGNVIIFVAPNTGNVSPTKGN